MRKAVLSQSDVQVLREFPTLIYIYIFDIAKCKHLVSMQLKRYDEIDTIEKACLFCDLISVLFIVHSSYSALKWPIIFMHVYKINEVPVLDLYAFWNFLCKF